MKKLIIGLILIIILIILELLAFKTNITGNIIKYNQEDNKEIPDKYSYTKAICNSSNYCQDHEISCESNKITQIKPITGAVVQFDENWEDPRDEEQKDKLCG